jgi:hypothetical protein
VGINQRFVAALYQCLFYVAVFLNFHLAQLIVLYTYNLNCPPGDRFLVLEPMHHTVIAIVIILIPVAAARTKFGIGSHFWLSIIYFTASIFNLYAATATPLECVTMGGNYDDKASGLFFFMLFSMLMIFLIYLSAAIDLLFWGLRWIMDRKEY